MFFKELRKCGNGNIKGVVAIMLLDAGEFGLGGNTSGFLEIIKDRFGFGIDRINQRFEGVIRSIVEKSAFLEKEGNVGFAPSLTCVSRILPSTRSHLTVSLSILQISADPAFVTGRTLINFASWTVFAFTDVK